MSKLPTRTSAKVPGTASPAKPKEAVDDTTQPLPLLTEEQARARDGARCWPADAVTGAEVDGKLVLDEQALKLIASLPNKVGVVAVAGLWRTGKSFLLNRLVDRQVGFKTGHTINGCTRGIWVWGKPVERTLPDGEKMHVLLVDTEGLGATDNTQSHDARIFSLAVLLSSLFVYNSAGPIDEHAIQNLSFVANLTRHIHVKSRPTGDVDDGLEFHAYFPSLLWVLRDFGLELKHEGRPITSKEYLENSLKHQSGFSERLITKNQIRTMLTSFFRERDCVALVRPLEQEDALQRMDSLPYEKLRPEFRQGMEALKAKVFASVRPKAVHGRLLSGPMLAALVRAYVEAINRGATPSIQGAWEAVVEIECQGAVGAAVKAYRAAMEAAVGGRLPVDPPELHAAHVQGKQAGNRAFAQHAVGGEADLDRHRGTLKARYAEEYDVFVSQNEDDSIRLCKRLLTELSGALEQRLAAASYESYAQFDADRLALRELYLAQARGPAKYVAYGDWVEPKMSEAALKLSLQAEAATVAERTRLREAAEGAERRLLDATIAFEREKAALKEEREAVERRLAEAAGKEAAAREALAEARRQQEAGAADWRGLLERSDGEKRELQRRLEGVQERLVEAERRLVEARFEFEREKLQLREQALAAGPGSPGAAGAEELRKQLEEAQLRAIQLQAQVDVFKGKRREEPPSKASKQAASAAETAKIEKLKARFAEEKAALNAEWEAKLSAARAQADEERREAKREKEEAVRVACAGLDELKTELRSQLSQAQSRLAMSEQAREALQRRYDSETAALRADLAAAREEAARGPRQKLLDEASPRSDASSPPNAAAGSPVASLPPSTAAPGAPTAGPSRQCGSCIIS
eukprot:tig00020563_g11396.t1